MESTNKTRNQHYVSQAEQRLNAINPNAAAERQRIYSFAVADRETHSVQLEDGAGIKIRNNLSWMDLFTFDALDAGYRENLESCFRDYENDVALQSQALVQKLADDGRSADIRNEVINIFAAKFLNFLRNPYSVQKVLNTVHPALQYHPTDPQLLKLFQQVLQGNKPHEHAVCREFGLTPQMYRAWLQALFMLLIRDGRTEVNGFEGLVKTLFESKHVTVQVHRFTDPSCVCLLSDRGFNARREDTAITAFDFNLSANAFVQYAFCDLRAWAPPDTDPEVLEELERLREIKLYFHQDDRQALVNYNRLTVYQCYARVYAARPAFPSE